MDRDRPRVDQRRQVPTLEDVRDRDQGKQDHDPGEAVARPRHQDEDRRGDGRSDVRNEAAEEDDHGQRPSQRHAQDREEDEVRDRVGGGGHGGRAEIAPHQVQGVAAARRQALTAPAGRAADRPLPGLFPVLQQEEREEAAQERDRGEGGHGPDSGGDQGRDPVLDPARDLLDRGQDLGRDGDVRQSRPKRRQTRIDGRHHGTDGRDEGEDDQDQGANEDQQGRETHDSCRLGRRPAPLAQRVDVRREGRGDDHGDHDRCGHGREGEREGHQDQAECQRDQEPPAKRGQVDEPRRDQRATGWHRTARRRRTRHGGGHQVSVGIRSDLRRRSSTGAECVDRQPIVCDLSFSNSASEMAPFALRSMSSAIWSADETPAAAFIPASIWAIRRTSPAVTFGRMAM